MNRNRISRCIRFGLEKLEGRELLAVLSGFQPVPNLGSMVYESSVIGSLGSPVLQDGFESGNLGSSWSTFSSNAHGRIQVTSQFGAASGSKALLMDTTDSGIYNLNEAIWHVQQPTASGSLLHFSYAVFNDELQGFFSAPSYSGHFFADGVSVSNDGSTWYPVWDPLQAGNPTPSTGQWIGQGVDLKAASQAGGYSLNLNNFYVKFQQFDNFPLTTDGLGWDDIQIVAPGGPAGITSLTVDAGQSITVLVDGTGTLQPQVRLLSGNNGNNVVGSAVATAPGGEALIQSVAVGGKLADGTPGALSYRIEVSGAAGNLGDYTVRVVLNAALEKESHGGANDNTLAGAQSLENSFLQLHRSGAASSSGAQPARAAVLGKTDRSASSGIVLEREVNNPFLPAFDVIDHAQNIDGPDSLGSGWNLIENPDIADSTTLPHISIQATGDGTFDYYSFTVANAGDRAVFDIDYESSFFGENLYLDTTIFLYDANGILLDQNDDFGDEPGSNTGLASYLEHYFSEPGAYYLAVGQFPSSDAGGQIIGTPFFDGDAYTLHVSLDNHLINSIVGDPLFEVEPNQLELSPPNLLDFAQDLDREIWVVNDDPAVPFANAVPHVLVQGTGDGTFDFYSFTVPSGGRRVTANFVANDINSGGGGQLYYYDSAGFQFSADRFDGILEEGTYFVAVGTFDTVDINGNLFGTAPQVGDSYSFFVSVDGHTYELPTPDLFAFQLRAGESVSMAVTALGTNSNVTVGIVNAAGTMIANGSPAPTNVGVAIDSFIAPSNATYYARVTGQFSGTNYNLVINRNATMDLERNSSIAAAQPIYGQQVAGRRWVSGWIEDGITLNAVDSGWYDNFGFHNSVNTNYFVSGLGTQEARNFFVFDLNGFSEPITAATLALFNPASNSASLGYLSDDPTETYTLFDVNTPIDSLKAGGFGHTATFADLGTGMTLGSRVVSAADNGNLVTIPLNSNALSNLNASTGEIALGGALTTLARRSTHERMFGFTSAQFTRQLNLQMRDSDFYRIVADENAMLQFDTATPGDGTGDFINSLDAMIRLYDSAGNLVASNDNGGIDSHNSAISYKVPKGKGGSYYIEVTASTLTPAFTSGEYILSIKGDRYVAPATMLSFADAITGKEDHDLWFSQVQTDLATYREHDTTPNYSSPKLDSMSPREINSLKNSSAIFELPFAGIELYGKTKNRKATVIPEWAWGLLADESSPDWFSNDSGGI